MTTTTGTLPTTPRYATPADALRALLSEVTPGTRPYSSDSYLPAHLVQAAQTALNSASMEAHQHAHNALMCAAWHIARGEPAKALARLRRVQSHITASMTATTNVF